MSSIDWPTLYFGGLIASMLWCLMVQTTSRLETLALFLMILASILWPISLPIIALLKALR